MTLLVYFTFAQVKLIATYWHFHPNQPSSNLCLYLLIFQHFKVVVLKICSSKNVAISLLCNKRVQVNRDNRNVLQEELLFLGNNKCEFINSDWSSLKLSMNSGSIKSSDISPHSLWRSPGWHPSWNHSCLLHQEGFIPLTRHQNAYLDATALIQQINPAFPLFQLNLLWHSLPAETCPFSFLSSNSCPSCLHLGPNLGIGLLSPWNNLCRW